MFRTFLATALVAQAVSAMAQTTAPAAPAAPVSAAKKELVAKVLQLQQPGYEAIARSIVERPVVQLMQDAGRALQTQVPPEKREAAGKAIEADVKKFVDESVPILRDRAIKLAPSTFGTTLEEKFTEDELKQFIAWTESPVNRKLQQTLPEVQNGFAQKLAADGAPLLDPKLQALLQKVRTNLGVPAAAASGPAPAAAKPPAAAAPSVKK